MSPALIAIDWGSSSFCAYLISPVGEVLDEFPLGRNRKRRGRRLSATLKRLIGGWLDAHPSLPVIASGMVGSRHGWREAAYVKCPAGPPDVAKRISPKSSRWQARVLAPGLSIS